MKSKILIVLMLFLIALMPGAYPSAQATPPSITGQTDQAVPPGTTCQTDQPSQTSLMETYARLPLLFIHNQGQLDSQVEYYVKMPGQTIYLTPSGMVFDLIRYHNTETADLADRKAERLAFSLDFVDANTSPLIQGSNKDRAVVNYLIGNDPNKWHTDIPTYREVLYKDVYPGIDLRLYGKENAVEYEFVVQPGADVSGIALAYSGVDGLDLESNELVVSTAFGDLKQSQPYIYQQIGGDQVAVAGGFSLLGADSYGFQVGNYDAGYPLIIDPSLALAYSTYLGGNGQDTGLGIAVESGYAYVIGETTSTDFPTKSYYHQEYNDSNFDVFVAKLDTTQSGDDSLIYSTYLGGSGVDGGYGIAVESGCAYVTGVTQSSDFPTFHAYQTDQPEPDAFVTRFNAAGDNVTYSTYLGGSGTDGAYGIAVESEDAYVTGQTTSADFPNRDEFQTDYGGAKDAFITRLDTTETGGASLIYSTYLGGDDEDCGNGIAVDSECAYVTGYTDSINFPTLHHYQTDKASTDAFVSKLDTSQTGEDSLSYSTYLGGSSWDNSRGIAVEMGEAYVAGQTYSTDFPTVNQYQGEQTAWDAFVTRFNAAGDNVTYSTYLGGNSNDFGRGIAVESECAYVTGYTVSANFPILNYYQDNEPYEDAFMTKLDTSLWGTSSLIHSTYLGGDGVDYGNAIAMESECAYVVGETDSSDFPTENEYQDDRTGWDAFVTKFGSKYTATVTTNDATSVEETIATLNGTLTDDGGEACEYRFQYDTDLGEPYAHQTAWTGSKTTGETFFENIIGLSQGTEYHFRAEAVNSAGTVYGSDRAFTTKPDAPTGFNATAISASRIDLSWTKGAGAQKTMIRRSTVDYPTAPDAGDLVYNDTGASYSNTGLTDDTTYYYSAWSWVDGSDIWSDTYDDASAKTYILSTVTGVNPTSGGRDDMLDVIIIGTKFIDVSAVSFGAGIDVNTFNTDNTTQITATITIALDAALGTRDVSVTTPGGIATLPAGFTVTGASLPGVAGDYSIKSSIKFYDWRCNKWIVVTGGTLHITEQDKHKIQGYWEPDVALGWSDNVTVKGYVGPFHRDDKGKIKNTPRLSLLLQLGTYCEYPAYTYATYIVNGKIKMDKKIEVVKSIKCTLNGWGEYGTEFTDIGGPSQGQFEGKLTATPLVVLGGVPMPQGSMEYAPSAMVMPGTGAPAGPVPTLAIAPMVAAGGYHTVGLIESESVGTVVAEGDDTYGQCSGVSLWTAITQVAAGLHHTVGLKSDGSVVAAGNDGNGQCSGVSTWAGITQVAAGGFHTVGRKSDGTVVAVGSDSDGQVSGVGTWANITQVSAGGNHTVGLEADGDVVAVGNDSDGQVSGVSTWASIDQVSAGGLHTVGLEADGDVVAVGDDTYGQVSGVSTWSSITQVSAGGNHTVGLTSTGTVVAVGDDTYGQCSGVSTWSDIIQVAAGGEHTVGLKSDGTVVAVGNNDFDQCDIAAWNLAAIPDVVGDYPCTGSVKFYDWKCNKSIVVLAGILHITTQNENKITGYWEPQPAIEGWPTLAPVSGYVGPFYRDAKKKIKNTPRLSLVAEYGTYCTYPTPYVTYIINGKVKWDKKTNAVKTIKCTINGWGEWGAPFVDPDNSASLGQFEGKFTAAPPAP